MEGRGGRLRSLPEDLDSESLNQLVSSKVKFYAARFSTEQISVAGLMGTLSGSPGEVKPSHTDYDTCNAAPRLLQSIASFCLLLTCIY